MTSRNTIEKTPLITISKVFTNVCIDRGTNYYTIEDIPKQTCDTNKYEISNFFTTAKYSDIFIGFKFKEEKKVIIKILKPVRSNKYSREVKILNTLSGGPNIIEFLDCIKINQTQYSLIFNYFEHLDYSKLYLNFSDLDIRIYLYKTLQALYYSHSNGIIHRDIKPQNILYNPKNKELRLIDWGLAEFYRPGEKLNTQVCARNFKPIEILLSYPFYDYSLDIWCFGVLMLGILLNKTPFFKSNDDFDLLKKIVYNLGYEDFEKYIKKYNIEISNQILQELPLKSKRKNFYN